MLATPLKRRCEQYQRASTSRQRNKARLMRRRLHVRRLGWRNGSRVRSRMVLRAHWWNQQYARDPWGASIPLPWQRKQRYNVTRATNMGKVDGAKTGRRISKPLAFRLLEVLGGWRDVIKRLSKTCSSSGQRDFNVRDRKTKTRSVIVNRADERRKE